MFFLLESNRDVCSAPPPRPSGPRMRGSSMGPYSLSPSLFALQTGVVMFSAVIVIVHLEVASILEQWTWLHHFSIWASQCKSGVRSGVQCDERRIREGPGRSGHRNSLSRPMGSLTSLCIRRHPLLFPVGRRSALSPASWARLPPTPPPPLASGLVGLPAGLQLVSALHLPRPLLAVPRGRCGYPAVLALRAACASRMPSSRLLLQKR